MDLFKIKPVEEIKYIKGIPFANKISFRQLLVTGPPGAGKSTLIRKLGGWSEEGYIDLSRDKWWTAQCLSLRPREVHLGFPFKGYKESLAVFDKTWVESIPHPEIDLERIKIPPIKRYFFSVNWYKRYAFEFILPPLGTLFERRLTRARRGTHPVDDNLEREIVAGQLRVYQQAALFLHQVGFIVYIRTQDSSLPQLIVEDEP